MDINAASIFILFLSENENEKIRLYIHRLSYLVNKISWILISHIEKIYIKYLEMANPYGLYSKTWKEMFLCQQQKPKLMELLIL